MLKKDFLWGSASAAYQIEGAAQTDGKGLSIWDEYSHIKGNTFKDTNGDVAIDFYHKYKEDIKLMSEMGLEAYRFSVSWPRILPEGSGEVNQEGIDFYHNVIDELIKYGIEPILTIYHWDLPLALQQKYGGWEDRQIIDDFTNFSKILFKEYGQKVKYFVTLNEQNIFTEHGYVTKLHPPKVNDLQRFLNANHNANLANAKVIALYKEMNLPGKIGPSFAYNPIYAKNESPKNILALENAQEFLNWFWMDVYAYGKYPSAAISLFKQNDLTIPFIEGDQEILLNGKPDFMGVNYYQSMTVSSPDEKAELIEQTKNSVKAEKVNDVRTNYFKIIKNEFTKFTDWNWAIDPTGLEVSIRRITSRYNLPILITENGLGAFDDLTSENEIHDEYRIDYIKEHIIAIQNAVKDGCDVLGYCTWSFQDLFSWTNGYQKRYGFVYVDRDEMSEKELKRYKKDSYYWYNKVIKNNGIKE